MKLSEACKSALEGNFISHRNFDSKQSMHSYNGDMYYEDGANLTVESSRMESALDFLRKEEWAQDGWYIKYDKEKVDADKLSKMHRDNNGHMLPYDRSYEEAILNNKGIQIEVKSLNNEKNERALFIDGKQIAVGTSSQRLNTLMDYVKGECTERRLNSNKFVKVLKPFREKYIKEKAGK